MVFGCIGCGSLGKVSLIAIALQCDLGNFTFTRLAVTDNITFRSLAKCSEIVQFPGEAGTSPGNRLPTPCSRDMKARRISCDCRTFNPCATPRDSPRIPGHAEQPGVR